MTIDELKEHLAKDELTAEGIGLLNELLESKATLTKDTEYLSAQLSVAKDEAEKNAADNSAAQEKIAALRLVNQELLSKVKIEEIKTQLPKEQRVERNIKDFFKSPKRKINNG